TPSYPHTTSGTRETRTATATLTPTPRSSMGESPFKDTTPIEEEEEEVHMRHMDHAHHAVTEEEEKEEEEELAKRVAALALHKTSVSTVTTRGVGIHPS
ncbi:hypothetical protein PENTCL1PPCAC_11803, partial [Pristionchus entomophagus]